MATFTFRINDKDVIQKLKSEHSISDVIRSALKTYYNTENVIQEEKAVIQQRNTEGENVIQDVIHPTKNITEDVIHDNVNKQLEQFENKKSIIENLLSREEELWNELFPVDGKVTEYKTGDIITVNGQKATVKSVDDGVIIYEPQSNPGKYKSVNSDMLLN